jgi:uncharacterized caspase-like protein/uncharacterized protein YraI
LTVVARLLVQRYVAAPLLAIAIAVAGWVFPATAEPRFALVIGNSNYTTTSPLANPANDAKLVAGALETAGFDVSALTDLDQRDMRRAVRDFAAKVAAGGDGAVALFYYAGHGLQVDGTNYLVPVDAGIERESDVAIEALGLPDILSSIEQAGAAVNIVILDACRDNPLKRSFRSTARGLARVDAPTGSIVAYATAPGETAADGSGTNSPYSAALAAGLSTPGLPIEQLFKQVRIKVKAETGDKQVPWESSSLTSDFFFVRGDAPIAPVTPPPVADTPTPQKPAANDQLAEADYLAAVATDTVEAYRGFLEKYPASPRAGQVRSVLTVKVEDDAWRRAVDAGSAAAYRQYLAAFPDGGHVAAAETNIAALEAPPPPDTGGRTLSGDNCGPSGDYRVTGIPANDSLSIRATPDRNATEVGVIPPDGGGIAVGGCRTVQGYKFPWCEVTWRCARGWAYSRYLIDSSGSQPGDDYASTAVPAGPESYRIVGIESWDVLNMRSGPGTNYPIVVPIPPDGTGVSVFRCRAVQGYRTKWCKTSWQGYEGWASACCLVGERTGRRLD